MLDGLLALALEGIPQLTRVELNRGVLLFTLGVTAATSVLCGLLPAFYAVRTMDQLLGHSLATRRLTLVLLSSFAGLALLLAAIGIYGVIAYAVRQRTHEIAIRLALGSQVSDVLRLMVGQGMKLIALSLILGLSGAWALTRLLTKLLFNVQPTDALTFAGVVLLLTAVALLACYLPARRAAKVDPMVALRNE